MRTIYGNLKVDKMTTPNPSLVIEHDKNIFPIGMTLGHFGEHDPLEMVIAYGRSSRLFFREVKNAEDKPARQLIVPKTTKVAKDALLAVHATDNEEFLILDFCGGDEALPYVAMTDEVINPKGVIVWDFQYDRLLNFQCIDEYDLFISAQPEVNLSATPIPDWTRGKGYSFSEEDFIKIDPNNPCKLDLNALLP